MRQRLKRYLPLILAVPISIQQPPQGGVNANTPLSVVLQNAITIIFVVAALLVVFMLVVGALQWILSGGDKEAVGKARGRITNALIGLAILALSFLIVRVVGQIVNVDIFSIRAIPTLQGT